MGPEDLNHILSALPKTRRSPKLLVGPETWDDAGVYRIAKNLALAQTVDFITPVVDNPRHFGAIAAANALSDIYAMGGKPTLALSIVCYPSDTGDLDVMREILRGGVAKLREAGVVLLGGHSVRDREIKFGFAVTGEVHPRRIVTNARARLGDLLVLTKPLGTGILATALKRGVLPVPALRAMTREMSTLNRVASEAMVAVQANAATDVTGFGLLGHALNMARASGKTLRIWSNAVPFLPNTLELVRSGVASAGLTANQSAVAPQVSWADGVPEPARLAMVDPQTSGGLLVALPASRVKAYLTLLSRRRIRGVVVGEVVRQARRLLEVAV